MSLHEFFLDSEKRAIVAAVREAEKLTAAEIVVTVRRSSGSYRAADYLGGAIAALGVLGVFLYYPEPFEYTYFPLEQAAGFALGAVLTNAIHPLKRALAGERAMEESVKAAAARTFMELRMGRTRARAGVLVYVSALERAVAVVPDVGIDPEALGTAWEDAVKKIERAVSRAADPKAFGEAIVGLGEALSKPFPRRSDDENELPDDVDDGDEEEEEEDDEADEDVRESEGSS